MQTDFFSFVFTGASRPWRPLEGSPEAPPPGNVWELRSLPGNVVAAGSTRDEAAERLRKLLENQFSRAGSVAAWYRNAMTSMRDDEFDQFTRVVEILTARGVQPRQLPNAPGRVYDLEPDECAV